MTLPSQLSECPICGEIAVAFHDEDRTFPFGVPPNQIEIHVRVPLGRCSACRFAFTDQRAEVLCDDAVRIQLGGKP